MTTMLKRVSLAFFACVFFAGAAFAEVILNRGNTDEPDTLDPHLAQGTWENNIIGDMIIGLYTEDPEAKPIFGAAIGATTSPDGLVWTFTLRDHKWSDGVKVTADDFVYAWRRILDPKTGAQYASLLFDFKNARAINDGAMPPEALGARAIDDETLELTLEHPAPYLPQLMTHYTTFPVPRHVVEKLGRDWVKPGNYVGNGPYIVVEWVPNDHIKSVKNPLFWDADKVQIDTVYYYPTRDTSAALKRFRAGELDMQNGLTAQDIVWIKQNIPDQVYLRPLLAISYVALNSSQPPLNDKDIREALNLAFNRDTIATKVLKDYSEIAAYSLTPPGTAGTAGGAHVAFQSMSYGQRLARAKALMVKAGYGPDNHLKLAFEIGPSIDNKRDGAAIQQMWAPIYVDVDIHASESKVLYAALREGDFQTSQAAWVGDYNDAKNFLFLFRTDTKDMNYGRYSNPAFDQLVDQSDHTADAAERGKLLAQAEQILLDDSAFIPNRFINTRYVVAPYVKGFVPNLRDINRTRWLSIEGRPGAVAGVPTGGSGPSVTTDEKGWLDRLWEWFAGLMCSWFGWFCTASS